MSVDKTRSQPARQVDQPEPGWFLTKIVKGGPWVAARIHHEDGQWWASINGEEFERSDDPVHAPKVISLWHYGTRSTEEECSYRLALKKHHAGTDHPSANPTMAINLDTMKSIF